MEITLKKIPTGIHNQIALHVENLHRAGKQELDLLSKVAAIVKEYNDDQDANA